MIHDLNKLSSIYTCIGKEVFRGIILKLGTFLKLPFPFFLGKYYFIRKVIE